MDLYHNKQIIIHLSTNNLYNIIDKQNKAVFINYYLNRLYVYFVGTIPLNIQLVCSLKKCNVTLDIIIRR